MVSLENKQFDKLCSLAKLKISDDERVRFMNKMEAVFDWINQLEQINTDGIDIDNISNATSTRERISGATMTNNRKDILSNTKYKKFDMFCVPKIVE